MIVKFRVIFGNLRYKLNFIFQNFNIDISGFYYVDTDTRRTHTVVTCNWSHVCGGVQPDLAMVVALWAEDQ